MGEDRLMRKRRWLLSLLFCFSISFLLAANGKHIPDTLPSMKFKHELPEVLVKRNRLPLRIHGDTISFNAAQYIDINSVKLEDLLKRMPGFTVDENGRILFNGKQITKILIEGDDLSGARYTALSRNLRASTIKELQVVQHFQENRLMKDHVNSDAIAINLKINKEFLGRPTGNLSASSNLGSYGSINADLLRLHNNSKQLFFLDKNNIGGQGVVDDENSQQHLESGSAYRDKIYRSWPFLTNAEQQHEHIPAKYRLINNDYSAMVLSNHRISGQLKLQTALNIENKVLFQFSTNAQQVSIPGASSVEAFSTLSENSNNKKAGFRLVLDRDNHYNRVGRYQIIASYQDLRGGVKENRYLLEHSNRFFQQQHQGYSYSFHQEETWSHGSSGLLVLENYFALNNNCQLIRVNDSFFNLIPYATHSSLYDQQLVHRGTLLHTHVGRILSISKARIRFGLRASFESVNSALDENKKIFSQGKTYSYLTVVRQIFVKVSQEFQAAIGTASFHRENGNSVNGFIYRVEHSTVWQKKPLEKIRFGVVLERSAPDLRIFHAGPLFLYNGVIQIPSAQVVYPNSAELQLDITKIDLYKGLTAMFSIRARQSRKEIGAGSFVHPSFTAVDYFIMMGQRNFSALASLQQFLFPLKIKYAFNGSLILMKMPQQLNKQLFQSSIYNVSLDQKLISNWKGRFNVEVFYNNNIAIYSSRSSASAQSIFCRFRYGAYANVRFASKLSGSIQYSAMHAGKDNFFPMLDGRCKATVGRRLTASLEVVNILNINRYSERTVGLYTNGLYQLQLNGRRILLGVNLSF
jgi:hypothetical protein